MKALGCNRNEWQPRFHPSHHSANLLTRYPREAGANLLSLPKHFDQFLR